jgi:hypothetical protein
LIDTRTKCRDVRECEYGAKNPPIGSNVGGYPKKKTSISVASFEPVGRSIGDYPSADPGEIPGPGKSICQRTADIVGRHAKHRRGGAVESSNFALAIDYNDRKIDRIKQADIIAANSTQRSVIAWHGAVSNELVLLRHLYQYP